MSIEDKGVPHTPIMSQSPDRTQITNWKSKEGIPNFTWANTHWNGDFDTPMKKTHIVNMNFQINIASGQLINQC